MFILMPFPEGHVAQAIMIVDVKSGLKYREMEWKEEAKVSPSPPSSRRSSESGSIFLWLSPEKFTAFSVTTRLFLSLDSGKMPLFLETPA